MTAIEWTDKTWNPVTGCDKVSPGCDHCYAEGIANRFAGTPQFPNGFGVTLHADRLDIPLHWRKPRRIFVCSMADLFHDDVPDEFIARVWMTMHLADQHTFQILTKRPGRMRSWVQRWTAGRIPHPDSGHTVPGRVVAPNIWLGVSAENQKWADIRIPVLLDTPAAVRFVSAEPLLGPLDLAQYLEPLDDPTACGDPEHCSPWARAECLDWVIAGGESGPGARPMHPDWARSIRDQCTAAGVAFHFKQHGAWAPIGADETTSRDTVYLDASTGQGTYYAHRYRPGVQQMTKVGKKAAGRELDGRTWDEFPDPS